MKLLRIKADYVENRNEHFIFLLLADDENRIVTDTEMFGYVVDDEEEEGLSKFPFIITATTKNDNLILNYGAGLEYLRSKINLPKIKLKINEYFTRWDGVESEEYTYIISHITEIIS